MKLFDLDVVVSLSETPGILENMGSVMGIQCTSTDRYGELDLRDRENHIFVLYCTICVDRWTTVSETTLRLIYDLHTTYLNEILMDNCLVSFLPLTTVPIRRVVSCIILHIGRKCKNIF